MMATRILVSSVRGFRPCSLTTTLRWFSVTHETHFDGVIVSQTTGSPTVQWKEAPVSTKVERITNAPTLISATSQDDNKLAAACGTVDVDDDEMEQEEMFVDPHKSLGHDKREWGGPRRGGRLLEPTRFGDWERKGRCSDF